MNVIEKIREKAYSQQEVEEIGKQETRKAINKHDGSLMKLAKRHVEEQIWVKVDDGLAIVNNEMLFLNEKGLLEYLASLEHLQWSHITRHFFEFINPSNRKRWKRQMHAPYNKLTEKEKESDREWAKWMENKVHSMRNQITNNLS